VERWPTAVPVTLKWTTLGGSQYPMVEVREKVRNSTKNIAKGATEKTVVETATRESRDGNKKKRGDCSGGLSQKLESVPT
jgi:hypothetical protein